MSARHRAATPTARQTARTIAAAIGRAINTAVAAFTPQPINVADDTAARAFSVED